MDDSECVLIHDEEFKLVDEAVQRFEQLSGAILNRSSKSKVLGLGSWKTRNVWPLSWLKTVDSLKIFVHNQLVLERTITIFILYCC